MTLAVSVTHRAGDFTLEVDFESHGRLTAIFGASGSGKTTLVNAIAGLVRPERARIAVGDALLADTAKGVFQPPHRRRIGYVFQDARLLPHLSVESNLSYGTWFTPAAHRYANRDQIIALLGLGSLLKRKPSSLSGGEKQRVAIGRALLASPRLLLMDEPLASLDAARKAEIIPYIERLRDEVRTPIVYVSHSVAEVTRLATDILVLAQGRRAAFGPAAEIAQRLDLVPDAERDEGGAILDMEVRSYTDEFGMTHLASAAGEVQVPGFFGPPGTAARVRIRARDVMLALDEPKTISALNILRGEIMSIAPSGSASVDVAVSCSGETVMARVTRQSSVALGLAPGRTVFAVVKAVSVSTPGASPH